MSNTYRYILDKTSKKYLCPGCGKKSFVRYMDTKTGQYLPEKYGRCDREINCAYHLNPYKEEYGNEEIHSFSPMPKPIRPNPAYIPAKVLKQTLMGYELNIFLQNLLYNVPFPVEKEDLEVVVALYFLGSVNKGYRVGAVTFPFIDMNGKVRAIQVKQFNKQNHTIATDFIHTIIEKQHKQNNEPLPEWLTAYQKNEKKVSCLFGEHLLKKYPYNPIALVESPKTVIYGTLYFGLPDNLTNMLWLAVYNLSSLTYEKCCVLKGRQVFLFPDLSKDGKAFNIWSLKAREFSIRMPGTLIKVSDLLELEANETERINGLDLADFLIKQDWRSFRPQLENVGKSEKGEKGEAQGKHFFPSEEHPEKFRKHENKNKSSNWDQNITELEKFFNEVKFPTEPIKLNDWSLITDVSLFVESNLAVVRSHNGNTRYKPYLERLIQLKSLLSSN